MVIQRDQIAYPDQAIRADQVPNLAAIRVVLPVERRMVSGWRRQRERIDRRVTVASPRAGGPVTITPNEPIIVSRRRLAWNSRVRDTIKSFPTSRKDGPSLCLHGINVKRLLGEVRTLMIRPRTLHSSALATLLIFILGAVLWGSCGALADGDESKAAVEAGRGAGLEPYWLGEGFVANDKEARDGETKFHGPEHPQVVIHYFLEHGANGRVEVRTYFEAQGGWELILDGARTLPGTSVVEADVGSWSGQLWIVPLGNRPFNTVIYVLHINGMVVLATSKAASTGVPGTDVNPLIDAELWGQVLAEHLQPYPE